VDRIAPQAPEPSREPAAPPPAGEPAERRDAAAVPPQASQELAAGAPSVDERAKRNEAEAPKAESLGRAAAAAPQAAAFADRAAAVEPRDIISPDPLVRWRVGGPGMLQRSIDGGTTWQALPIDPAVQIRAGAAPSPDVCWFVGPAGTVLVTTGGRPERVPFPASIDLAGVVATDARTASVVAADGRTFRTTDGGASWSPRPQDF
jgi:hypothetical protein